MDTPRSIIKLNFSQSAITPRFFAICAVITFSIRIWLSRLGYNWDFESWELVAKLTLQGKNVYAETCRYNYAPLFIWIFTGLKYVFHSNFRTAVAILLSLADIGIAWVLYKRGNRKASLFILFSPVCMIISGFHNQIDNVSILIALLAVRYVETRPQYNSSERGWGLTTSATCVFALLLGFSLLAKHILIFFPLWLLFHKQLRVQQKLILITIPYLIFIASFLPYLSGIDGIVNNVIFYRPDMGAPLYNLLIGRPVLDVLNSWFPAPYKKLFFMLLISSGFFMRKKPLIEMLVFYYLFVLLFASMIYSQYLVIPMLFLAYFESRFWKWYNLAGLIFFLFNGVEPNLLSFLNGRHQGLVNFIEYNGVYVMVFILLLAVIDVTAPGTLHRKTIVNMIKPYL